jgi:diketogulonate reductase-like aldo/keto reductase
MPAPGMGTWRIGENASKRAAEVAVLRLGLDLGMRLIDTAQMYGGGGAEEVVGEAIRGRRDEVYVVSKFYPHHASRKQLRTACDGSRKRLGVDTIDCYLYHWRGSVPLAETVETLNELVEARHIAAWGVSNFDVDDMEELFAIPGGDRAITNQVMYNLARRGVEFDLLAWCAKHRVSVMAYSPLDEGSLVRHPALVAIAEGTGATPAQVALAWLLRRPEVVVIPKAAREAHMRANAQAAKLRLGEAALRALDEAFPPPKRKQRLAVI